MRKNMNKVSKFKLNFLSKYGFEINNISNTSKCSSSDF